MSRSRQNVSPRGRFWGSIVAMVLATTVKATDYHVAITGRDTAVGTEVAPLRTIQRGLNLARAGDRVLVHPGTYNERLRPVASGTAAAPIRLQSTNGAASTIISGTGFNFQWEGLLHLANRSHFVVDGFSFKDLRGNDVSGIRILGSGAGIEIHRCRIHEIRGVHAMAVTVYGSSSTAITGLVINECEMWNCEPAPSETVAVNGNVVGAVISNNYIHDVNNIGIDLIGGEKAINSNKDLGATRCVVRGNRVEYCRTADKSAVGIYIDGGDYNIIEGNIVRYCDVGMQVGGENVGVTANGNILRNNIIARNSFSGLILGAEWNDIGSCNGTVVVHNLFYRNDATNGWSPEILIEWGNNSQINYNIIQVDPGTPTAVYWPDEDSGGGHHFTGNVWHCPGANLLVNWEGRSWNSYTQFRNREREDAGGIEANPGLIDPEKDNYHLMIDNPATTTINEGSICRDRAGLSTAYAGQLDIDGVARVYGEKADVGPDEVWPIDGWVYSKFSPRLSYHSSIFADADQDGASNLLEYAGASDPKNGGSIPFLLFSTKRLAGKNYPVINWRSNRLAVDTEWVIWTHDGTSSGWKDAATDFGPLGKLGTSLSGGYDSWYRLGNAPIPTSGPACQCVLKLEARLVNPGL